VSDAGRATELTQVVHQREEGGTKKEGKQHRAYDVPVLEQARRQRALIALPDLDADEDDDHDAEADKQADHDGAVPRVLGASPLQRQQQAHDGRHQHGGAGEIQAQDALQHRGAVSVVGPHRLDVQKQEDGQHRGAPNGQVDVEAPAPADVVGKGAAQQGPRNARDPPHGADQAEGHGPLAQGQGVGQDDDAAGEQAGGADAGQGPADDERVARGRDGADQAANLEDEHGGQVGPLDAEHAVERAVGGLQRGRGQQVGGAVPADVLDGLKLARDGAQGGRDDGLVQRDEEDGQAQRGDDERQLDARRVDHVGVVDAGAGRGEGVVGGRLVHVGGGSCRVGVRPAGGGGGGGGPRRSGLFELGVGAGHGVSVRHGADREAVERRLGRQTKIQV
jgi:hypothetical protein